MDRQLAASPQTLGSSDVGSELLGTRTTGHEQATVTGTILDGAGLVTAPANGGNGSAERESGVHKLTDLPPLGSPDGSSERPLIAVMGCVVQDIVVKPHGPLTTNGSTMSRIAFAPGGFGPTWPGQRPWRVRLSAS